MKGTIRIRRLGNGEVIREIGFEGSVRDLERTVAGIVLNLHENYYVDKSDVREEEKP